MSRDRNTFAKRQRETKKKQKAEEKRVRRQERKTGDHVDQPSGGAPDFSGEPQAPSP